MKHFWIKPYLLFFMAAIQAIALSPGHARANGPDAAAIVDGAFNYMRDKASIAVVDMTIKRPGWERKMTIKAWTVGEENSIFRIVTPAKDKDNGTLKLGNQMWTYNPKVNRVIKIPPSMMSQAWMGSDFSNNDLAKTDSIIKDYTHAIKEVKEEDGHKVYVIESIPKPGAPVIWGKQMLEIRDDSLFLKQSFHDENMAPVKLLTFYDIKTMGGKLYPSKMKMMKADTEGEYTLVEYTEISFPESLPDHIFTVTTLKNPGAELP